MSAPATTVAPERENLSGCAWPASATARFRERDDDRYYTWQAKACTLCGTEIVTRADGTEVHTALGPRAEP